MTSRLEEEILNAIGKLSEQQQFCFDQLHTAFRKVDPGWLARQIYRGSTFEDLIDKMLNIDVYKVPCIGRISAPCPESSGLEGRDLEVAKTRAKDYDEMRIAMAFLANKFPYVNLTHMRTLYEACGANYWTTMNAMKQQYNSDKHKKEVVITIDQPNLRRRSIVLWVNKHRRCVRAVRCGVPAYLHDQERLLKDGPKEQTEPLPQVPEGDGQFECVICAGEKPMALSCSCSSGHVFCGECVAGYFKESIYGQAKASLLCMENDCKGLFTLRDVQKFLTKDAVKKFSERQDEEALVALGLDRITRCKYCNYAAIVEISMDVDKVFSCKRCEAQICRLCGQDWDERHIGFRCEELGKNDMEAKRRQFEERMSNLVIRHCHRCRLPMQKSDGCNKLTCTSCKATMCYICRTTGVNYGHFCHHGRDQPGAPCRFCRKCSLWEDVAPAEQEQLQRIQEAANNELGVEKAEVEEVPVAPVVEVPPPPPRPPPREEDYVCWPAAPKPRNPRGRHAARRAEQIRIMQAGGRAAVEAQRPPPPRRGWRHRIVAFFRRLFRRQVAAAHH